MTVRDRMLKLWQLSFCVLLFGFPDAVLANALERLPATTRPIEYRLNLALDPHRDRFTAVATIEFEVLRKTESLQLHARDLEVASAVVESGAAATVVYDPGRERVALAFEQPLAKGHHRLVIKYSGVIGDNVDGVFRVDYPTPAGVKRMLFAHSCCINTARLVMPSWDEPDRKARFALELSVPANLEAVANMPVLAQAVREDGRKHIQFAVTPPMSSYLWFFAVGELERTARRSGNIDVGVVTQRGKSALGEFALQASDSVLRYYDEYFDTRYPLPKLDHVAMPGSGSFGAMENWGAIFYFEPRLLLDPALATQRDRVGIYTLVAHEVAHQWFGNLVTARWWDDIWLNEAFASWMEIKASAHFNPGWNVPLHTAEDKEEAMRLDALTGTHPVAGPIQTIEQAVLAFDTITYNKGSQLITMLEAWMGEASFRAAIRRYVSDHAYANATSADLWRALDVQSSGFSISAMARDFTEQEGVPLIEVLGTSCDARTHRTTVRLRQRRFSLDTQPVREQRWRVPVQVALIGSDQVVRQVVSGPRETRLQLDGCGPVKVNAGESGYFRTLYDPDSALALRQNFSALAPIDQLGVLNDEFGLAQGAYTNFDRYLRLADGLTLQSEPAVLLQFTRAMTALLRVAQGSSSQASISKYAQNKFSPFLQRLSWSPRSDEPAEQGTLRAALIELLAEAGHSATLEEARRRFISSASDPGSLPPGLKKTIVESAGVGADRAIADELLAGIRSSTDPTEQRMYLLALARAADPMIAARTLSLTIEGPVPTPLLPTVLLAVAEHHSTLTYDFVTNHFPKLAPRLEATQRTTLVPELASKSSDAALRSRLDDFASRYLAPDERESVNRAKAVIAFQDRLRREGVPQVAAFIDSIQRSATTSF